jgi:pimeloyl-ACP methyl ester carboxylesterase
VEAPTTQFLDHDGTTIAWQVFGEGPAEILFIPGWVSNVDMLWQYPQSSEFLSALGGFARVAVYDKPGTGASDPLSTAPSAERRIDQLIAVAGAAGFARPTVVGVSEGGSIACLAAAGRPDRISRLVMLEAAPGAFDRRSKGRLTDAEFDAYADFLRSMGPCWGEGTGGERWLPDLPDPDAAWGLLQRGCATRAVARDYLAAMDAGLSAWDVLEVIRQPTLFLHRRDDRIVPAELARAAAERIPNATLVELDGANHLPWLGETTEMLARLRAFVGAPPPPARAERVLATVLFTDIVGSTDQLARFGDAAWSAKLDRHEAIVRDGLERFGGRLVKTTGDGALATFTGPARGAQAARWILDALAAEQLNARAGIHVGEIELQGNDIAGLAVHVAARVMGEAGDGEVLVTRTVRDLAAGSGLSFQDRGTHPLKGIPEEQQLYSLAALGAKGGTDRPTKAAFSGTTVLDTGPTGSIVEFTGTGRTTHGGKSTLESTGTTTFTSPTTFDFSASSTTTVANGDQQYSEEVGTGTFNADGGVVIDITSTTTGGTGRFEGASGFSTGTISNVASSDPTATFDTTLSTSGTISY